MEIKTDDLNGAKIRELLKIHAQNASLHLPPESVHVLGVEELRQPDVTFWTAWDNGELLGCGALKELNQRHGEVKSMRTAEQHLRKGVAAKILERIIEIAVARGYKHLSLETGSGEAFIPARKMYERFGFSYCEPFGDYTLDPYSVYMTKAI